MSTADELWQLLPSVYRQRDAEGLQPGFLRGLVEVLGEQADVVAEELAQLHDGWFIETCPPWAVPYIGDLVGARPLHPVGRAGRTPRAYVANTIGNRRRKGTVAALEQLARDVTGWPCRAIELYRLLAWSQFLGHLRPTAHTTLGLREGEALERLDGPFDTACRTADVRGARPDRPNIADLSLCVWRLEPFRLTGATALPVPGPPGRYLLDPLGGEVPLANAPLPEESIEVLATEHHVPGLLRRRALAAELDARRAGSPPTGPSFFGQQPVVRVLADTGAGLVEVPLEQLAVADLADPPAAVPAGWRRPAAPLLAAVDPVLGRLAFREGVEPLRVETDLTYLAPGRLGAGPYPRSAPVARDVLDAAGFARAVGRALPPRPDLTRADAATALADWGTPPPGTVGVVAVLDNRTYAGPLEITVPAGCTLLLTSGVWPDAEAPPVAGESLDPADLVLDERRPVLTGGLTVTGGPGAGPGNARGRLVVDGLVLAGGVTVAPGDLGSLRLGHTTVVAGGVQVNGGNLDLEVVLEDCLTGPVEVTHEGPRLTVRRSVIAGPDHGGAAVDAPETEAELVETTSLGGVRVRRLEARDCLLDGPVAVARTQQGCLSHCYLADAVRVPRRALCQPDLALSAAVDEPPSAVRARLVPRYLSRIPGEPGYGLLTASSAHELRRGSSGHGELGAYGHLHHDQREANLRTALEEYLPIGLTAALTHVT